MAQFEKYFTLEEATSHLPELRRLLPELRNQRDRLVESYPAAAPVLKQSRWDSGGAEAGRYAADSWVFTRLIRRLTGMGIQIKDIDRGLVDFPAWIDDEEVLLCWHLGEDEIGFWHDLESGFRGRKPL